MVTRSGNRWLGGRHSLSTGIPELFFSFLIFFMASRGATRFVSHNDRANERTYGRPVRTNHSNAVTRPTTSDSRSCCSVYLLLYGGVVKAYSRMCQTECALVLTLCTLPSYSWTHFVANWACNLLANVRLSFPGITSFTLILVRRVKKALDV